MTKNLTKLKFYADDTKQGFTLGELREVLEDAEKAGFGPDAELNATTSMRGRLRDIELRAGDVRTRTAEADQISRGDVSS